MYKYNERDVQTRRALGKCPFLRKEEVIRKRALSINIHFTMERKIERSN